MSAMAVRALNGLRSAVGLARSLGPVTAKKQPIGFYRRGCYLFPHYESDAGTFMGRKRRLGFTSNNHSELKTEK
jgi:hypothetical protein